MVVSIVSTLSRNRGLMVLCSSTNPAAPEIANNFAHPKKKMAANLASCSCFCNLSIPRNVSRKRTQSSSRAELCSPVMEPRTHKSASLSNKSSKNSRPMNPPDSDSNLSPLSTLGTYVGSRRFEDALHLFDEMSHSDASAWNVMIKGFTDHGLFREAVDFHRRMEIEGVRGDNFTYPFVIKACAGLLLMMEGKRVHGKVLKSGLYCDVYVCNSLISMYAKLGCLELAEKVFDEMPVRDLVSWNSMVNGYLLDGDIVSSFSCLHRMLASGIQPDRFSMISALGVCSTTCCLQNGKEIHCQAIRNGFESDIKVQTSLIDMYSKCKRIDYAEKLFDSISQKNIVVWNAMIGGYAMNRRATKSFACLKRMQDADNQITPDAITAVNVLPSCAQRKALLKGKAVHGYAIRNGFLPRLTLETALVDMYGRCEGLKSAERVFCVKTEKDLASWNAMITAYVQNGWKVEGLELFRNLLHEGLQPDKITLTSIVPAYVELSFLSEVRQMHSFVMKLKLDSHPLISNSIVSMYAKCEDLESARKHFESRLDKDVDSWNEIIMAHAVHGLGRRSIELFSSMKESPIKPNAKTYYALLLSCRNSGLIAEGLDYFNSMVIDSIDPEVEHFQCMLGLLGEQKKP